MHVQLDNTKYASGMIYIYLLVRETIKFKNKL